MGKRAEQAQEQASLTLAQELALMMDKEDADCPGMTVRQSLAASIIQKAREGNFKILEWLYQTSGERQRELDRKREIDRKLHPERHLFD